MLFNVVVIGIIVGEKSARSESTKTNETRRTRTRAGLGLVGNFACMGVGKHVW